MLIFAEQFELAAFLALCSFAKTQFKSIWHTLAAVKHKLNILDNQLKLNCYPETQLSFHWEI